MRRFRRASGCLHLLEERTSTAASLQPLLTDAVEKGFLRLVRAILIQGESQSRKIDSRQYLF
jgi:hypothetical protein